MHIAALDLMPLFWLLGCILSITLLCFGDRTAFFCTLPSALTALFLCLLHYPPRLQVMAFLLVAFTLCCIRFLFRCFFARKKKNTKKALD